MNREEQLLVGIVVMMSAAMLVGSFQYTPDARYLPQIVGAMTILLGVTIVVNDRFDLLTESSSNLVEQVQESSELDEQLHETAGSEAASRPELGVAAPGEFRIDQPIMEYRIPLTEYTVTHRVTTAVLLVVYVALVWLFGVFISSLVFLLLYARVVGLRRRVLVGLFAFIICVLLFFGMWLETPLFRPQHQLLETLGVGR